jgi:hypothetical protein
MYYSKFKKFSARAGAGKSKLFVTVQKIKRDYYRVYFPASVGRLLGLREGMKIPVQLVPEGVLLEIKGGSGDE